MADNRTTESDPSEAHSVSESVHMQNVNVEQAELGQEERPEGQPRVAP